MKSFKIGHDVSPAEYKITLYSLQHYNHFLLGALTFTCLIGKLAPGDRGSWRRGRGVPTAATAGFWHGTEHFESHHGSRTHLRACWWCQNAWRECSRRHVQIAERSSGDDSCSNQALASRRRAAVLQVYLVEWSISSSGQLIILLLAARTAFWTAACTSVAFPSQGLFCPLVADNNDSAKTHAATSPSQHASHDQLRA